jgi:hypothetical protein
MRAGRPTSGTPSEGADEACVSTWKTLAGGGTLDQRCARLAPYIVALLDAHLLNVGSTQLREVRRMAERHREEMRVRLERLPDCVCGFPVDERDGRLVHLKTGDVRCFPDEGIADRVWVA